MLTINDMLALNLQEDLTKDILWEFFADTVDTKGIDFDRAVTITVNGKEIETTIGRYVYNKFVLPAKLYDKLYMNETLDASNYFNFFSAISDAKNLEKSITAEEFADTLDRNTWLVANIVKMVGGGIQVSTSGNTKSGKKKIAKLAKDMNANKPTREGESKPPTETVKDFDTGVVEILKTEMGDSSLGQIVNSGAKGSWGNNMKAMFGAVGDYGEGFSPNSLEGMSFDDYASTNNLSGASARAINTAIGGYYSKLITIALSGINIDLKTQDCGTPLSYVVKDFDGFSMFPYRFVRLKGAKVPFKPLDREMSKDLVGKTVEVRSPLHCRNKKNGYCAKCVGEAYKYNNVTSNLGEYTTGITNDLTNKSMKAFHNTTIEYGTVDYTQIFS